MISFPEILLRLVVALVLGAIVGLERESREHAAGMRTNALVSMGCALFTLISAYGFLDLLKLSHVQLDPTRIASYIVAGIGFLGGGAIFLQRDRVRGLTTAAAIWTVAAIGMACGIGLLWEAALGTLLALVILVVLRYPERALIPRHIAKAATIQLELGQSTDQFVSELYKACNRPGIEMDNIDIQKEQEGEKYKISLYIKQQDAFTSLLDELRTLPNVRTLHVDVSASNNLGVLSTD